MSWRTDRLRRLAAAAAVAVMCSPMSAARGDTAAAPSGEWTGEWLMFRGDPQLGGTAAGDLPASMEPLWTFQAGDEIESTAAIAGGTVYVGSMDGHLYAIDLETGKERWKYEAADSIKSSPTVRGDTVYFGDEMGTFHAVDAGTGAARWTFQTDAGITSSANFAGDRIVFGSYDDFLYCISAADGKLLWKVETGSYVHATPAILDVEGESWAVSGGCDGYLRCVRLRDGAEVRTVELGAYVAASAAVRGGRAYVGTFENQFLGVDLENGRILWTYENPDRDFPFYSSPALRGNLLVFGGRDKLVHAVDAETGVKRWTFPARARVDSSPVIAGDRVVVASTAGALFLLNTESGEEVWKFETGSSFLASPSVATGRVVIGSIDGVIYCFGAPVPRAPSESSR